MKPPLSAPSWLARPSVLRAVDSPKPWGWEQWLTSTRPEGPAQLASGVGTLADLVAFQPEALGQWSRHLFGEGMPIFAKFIHTTFPRRVHLGFRRSIRREEFTARLEMEQEHLRRLLASLRLADAHAFVEYNARYSAWASRQSLAAWRRDDDDDAAASLVDFVDGALDLRSWLRSVRENRAAISETLNEIDLDRESGHLFLSTAGVVHAIFGLSHQTHPRDRARERLQTLFAELGERAAAGASDEDLTRVIDHAGLPLLRAGTGAPAKNEAWLATSVNGTDVLVEPQQASDTTYSLADFYTPLVWSGDRVTFRKGSPERGVSQDALAGYLDQVDFAVTSIDSVRRAPTPLPEASNHGASLLRLVDEPAAWPFFTAYQLELSGRFTAAPPPGVFQQLVVTRGRVELGDQVGPVGDLSPGAPGFVPATIAGSYTLTAREPSTVLLFAVPGARGGAPRVTP